MENAIGPHPTGAAVQREQLWLYGLIDALALIAKGMIERAVGGDALVLKIRAGETRRRLGVHHAGIAARWILEGIRSVDPPTDADGCQPLPALQQRD